MQDWTGNKKTAFVQLGASNHTSEYRETNDYYATDPMSLKLFLDRIKKDNLFLHRNIFECACGEGSLSETLKKQGYQVRSSDLINRGYGEVHDFLKIEKAPETDILTNPPYKYAQQFVEHALKIIDDGSYCIMFLKIQFLEGKQRRKLFDKYPPLYIYINSTRQTCYKNGDFSKKFSSAACYCWFVWQKGIKTEPKIRWI